MRSVTKNRESFRALLARDSMTVLPGGFSPLEAVMAEHAGFDAFFLAGSQTAGYLYAVPDAGILGLHDMAGQAGQVAGRAGIPVLASKAGMQAAWDALHDFRQRGTAALADLAREAAESPWGKVPLTSLTGADAVWRLEDEFLPAELKRDYHSTFGHTPST